MGRKKKGYNWKARDQPNGEIDNDEIKKLNQNVAPDVKDKEKYEGIFSLKRILIRFKDLILFYSI